MYRYFKKIGDTDRTSALKSKGLSDKNFKPSATSNKTSCSNVKLC